MSDALWTSGSIEVIIGQCVALCWVYFSFLFKYCGLTDPVIDQTTHNEFWLTYSHLSATETVIIGLQYIASRQYTFYWLWIRCFFQVSMQQMPTTRCNFRFRERRTKKKETRNNEFDCLQSRVKFDLLCM